MNPYMIETKKWKQVKSENQGFLLSLRSYFPLPNGSALWVGPKNLSSNQQIIGSSQEIVVNRCIEIRKEDNVKCKGKKCDRFACTMRCEGLACNWINDLVLRKLSPHIFNM